MNERKEKIMIALHQRYNEVVEMGYEVVGVFLQGSQNYNLDYEESDIDCKAIILPRFEDFVLNKSAVSTTHVCDNNEHIDLKDMRLMFDCFKKQNINFIEILFTEFYVMNPKYADLYQPMFDNAEKIARYNNYASINCMVGMSLEKYKALEHPYPATLDKIEKFGYDPKQLHHIFRLQDFMKRYINEESYKQCLKAKTSKLLIEIKKGYFNLENARNLAKTITDDLVESKRIYMTSNEVVVNKEVEKIMNDVLVSIMKHNFKTELGV